MTDGEQRAALAVVRSLGRAGYRPHVCSTEGRSLAGASRFATGETVTPDPLAEPARYVDEVARLIQRTGAELLIPIAEPSLLAILPARARFPGAHTPFVDVERFRRICDKALVLSMAPQVGIAVPRQCTAASSVAARQLPDAGLRFPAVVKPSRSVSDIGGHRIKLAVTHAGDADEYRRALDELPTEAYPLLVQERIVGPGIGVFLLVWQGLTRAVFAHRRIREKPPSGGVSTYRESIPAPADLVDRSRALLDRFGWEGVAMVEFKLDEATGVPYLMEINGRFWGSLQLAIDAGVDFPALLASCALGECQPPVTTYRSGVRSRWEWGEVDHLLARFRRSDAELALPPGAPTRWQTLAAMLRLWRRGDRAEVFRLSDPAPFIRETVRWFHGR